MTANLADKNNADRATCDALRITSDGGDLGTTLNTR
jgi:hypothetical protein